MHHELTEGLEQLKHELEAGEPLSESDRTQIEDVLVDIARLLDRKSEADADAEQQEEPHPETLAEQLRTATQSVEASHPNLTIAVGRLAEALSGIGI